MILVLSTFLSTIILAWSADVKTQFGVLHGTTEANYLTWRGIPFAEAPIGQKRYAAPTDWTAAYPSKGRDATKYGHTCVGGGGSSNEDCLFLNICTPPAGNSNVSAGPWPVMVWIYGGAFVSGSSNIYDCGALSSQHPVVVVTLNYRLASFGWMATPESKTTNFGLMDQQSALRWVKNNIAPFGGDPNNVLIFGESAGGMSVALHLLATSSKGLFHKAISESGFPSASTTKLAYRLSRSLAEYAGCPTTTGMLDCLRTKSTSQIVNAQKKMPSKIFVLPNWGPVLDGIEILEDPVHLYEEGKIHPGVSLIAGTNTNEGTMFIYGDFITGLSEPAYKKFVNDTMNGLEDNIYNATAIKLIIDQYPGKVGDNRPTASDLCADRTFVCGSKVMVRSNARIKSDSYLYHFHHTPCNPVPGWGVYHSSEIDFVWANSDAERTYKTFATQIGTYWTNFARSGDPNKPVKVPMTWPKYSEESDQNLILDSPFSVETGRRKKYCDFWEIIRP